MMPAGSVNGWSCPDCGRTTYVVHVDEGVTPLFLACRSTFDCTGMAVSLGYPSRRPPRHVLAAIAWEWYRPMPKKARRMGPAMDDHVRNGGLALRVITDAGREAIT